MPGLTEMTEAERQAALGAAQEARRARTEARRSAGVPGMREAIAAFCAACLYDPYAGGTANAQILACPSTSCALWPHRPGAPAEMPDGYEPVTRAGTIAAIRLHAGRGEAGDEEDGHEAGGMPADDASDGNSGANEDDTEGAGSERTVRAAEGGSRNGKDAGTPEERQAAADAKDGTGTDRLF